MSTFKTFEDIEAWKVSRELCLAINQAAKNNLFSRDFSLKDQIRRSSGSIMDNIAEGYGRGGNKEFIHFLCIARGSASEVKSQLYRALDLGYIDQQKFDHVFQLVSKADVMTLRLIQYLQKSSYTGARFKGAH